MSDDSTEKTVNASLSFDADEFPSQYELERLLGTGATGMVYLALDRLLGRKVAIKVLQAGQNSEDAEKRFVRQCKLLSNLDHPSIVKVFSGGISKHGQPYIVMEFIEGQSLKAKLEAVTVLSGIELKQIFAGVLAAISAAHAKGIIHRDIKPENIMLVEKDDKSIQPILLDFGIARSLDDSGHDAKLTSTGVVLGSPAFMSPEQCRAEAVSFESDIYSLGCVFYTCLTGRAPFEANSAFELMYKQLNEKPDFSVLPKDCERSGLKSILEKCLEKNVKDRYSSTDELLEQVNLAFSKLSYDAPPRQDHSSKSLLLPLVILGPLLLAGITYGVGNYSKRKVDLPTVAPNVAPATQASKSDLIALEKCFKKTENHHSQLNRFNRDIDSKKYKAEIAEVIEQYKRCIDWATGKLDGPDNYYEDRYRKIASDVFCQLGHAYGSLSQFKDAATSFRKAIDVWPDASISERASMFQHFGQFLMYLRENDQALAAYSEFLKSSKCNNPNEFLDYAKVALRASELDHKLGRYAEAIKYGEIAVQALQKVGYSLIPLAVYANSSIARDCHFLGLKDKEKASSSKAAEALLGIEYKTDEDNLVNAATILGFLKYPSSKADSKVFFDQALNYAGRSRNEEVVEFVLEYYADCEIDAGANDHAFQLAQAELDKNNPDYRSGQLWSSCWKIESQSKLAQHNLIDARKCFEKATKVCPRYLISSRNLSTELDLLDAQISAAEGDLPRAQKLFAASLPRLLNNPDYWLRLSVRKAAKQYISMLNSNEAEKTKMERLLKNAPGLRPEKEKSLVGQAK